MDEAQEERKPDLEGQEDAQYVDAIEGEHYDSSQAVDEQQEVVTAEGADTTEPQESTDEQTLPDGDEAPEQEIIAPTRAAQEQAVLETKALALDADAPKRKVKPPKKSGSPKKLLLVMGGILLVAGVGLGTYTVLGMVMPSKVTTDTTQQESAADTTTQTNTTDSKITDDLKTIDTGLANEQSDATSVDSALSDSSSQIEVPTE